jgi:hypothetical protein
MAYDFNGTNQRLSTASAPATNVPLTMACWFKTDSVTVDQTLVYITNSAANPSRFALFIAGTSVGDPLRAFVAGTNNTPSAILDFGTVTAGSWSHAAGVFTSATSRRAYLNASESSENTANVGAATMSSMEIGARSDFGNTALFMEGQIAEVGIWNVALTAAEVASLADGMTCDKVRPQSLVFYAPLVRDLIDVKGGVTITNNNTATVANHPRVYA